jgi:signal transduction histidine kinase
LSQEPVLITGSCNELFGPRPLDHLLHALNQPLTALGCALELGLTGERTPEDYRRLLLQARRQAEQLNQIARALGDYAAGLALEAAAESFTESSVEERGICVGGCTVRE